MAREVRADYLGEDDAWKALRKVLTSRRHPNRAVVKCRSLEDVETHGKSMAMEPGEHSFPSLLLERIGRADTKKRCKELGIDYSNLRKAARGERGISSTLATSLINKVARDEADREFLKAAYQRLQETAISEDRRRHCARPVPTLREAHRVVDEAVGDPNAWKDVAALTRACHRAVEDHRQRSKVDGIKIAVSLCELFEAGHLRCSNSDEYLYAHASMLRLGCYVTYSHGDASGFRRTLGQLQRLAQTSRDDWAAASYHQNWRRQFLMTGHPVDVRTALKVADETVARARRASRSERGSETLRTLWVPVDRLASQGRLQVRAEVKAVTEDDIGTFQKEVADIGDERVTLEDQLIADLVVADAWIGLGRPEVARPMMMHVLGRLGEHPQKFRGVRATANRVMGDLHVLEGVLKGKHEAFEDGWGCYQESERLFSTHGNTMMSARLGGRLSLANSLQTRQRTIAGIAGLRGVQELRTAVW